MAEYEDRERNYNNGLAKVVGAFAIGLVEADGASKDAYVDRQIRLMNQEVPNAEFRAKTTLIGLEQALETKVSVPKIVLAPSEPFIIERANLSMDMTVSASTEDNLSVRSDIEAEGEAKLGPLPVSLRIKAAVSVAKDQKRRSDYTSTTHADLTMCQGNAPEAVMKIIDAMTANTVKALELNASIVEGEYRELVAATDQVEEAEAV